MKIIKTYPKFLKEHVKFFYSIYESRLENIGEIHRRLPDGTLDLIFNLGATVSISRDGENFANVPEVALSGLHRDRSFMQYSGDVILVGAVFQPGSAHLFMNDSLAYHESSNLNASLVYGTNIYILHEQLKEPTDDTEKHNLIKTFLVNYLRNKTRKDRNYHLSKISGIVQQIHSLHGNTDMSQLYKNHFMSERNFRRQFTEYVGISPKLYSSIIRVKSFSQHYELERSSYTKILDRLGYHDPSHFNKEFHKIVGLAPTNYFGQLNEIGEEFIHLI